MDYKITSNTALIIIDVQHGLTIQNGGEEIILMQRATYHI
jgi:hypothetical protein